MLPLILLTLPPPLLRGSITVIYYLIPYWCCCPPEKVLVVIYYLILLPPLYWGHNAAFTVENATYGPTGEKLEILIIIGGKYICSSNMGRICKFTLLVLGQSIVVIGASYVLPEEYCGILQ